MDSIEQYLANAIPDAPRDIWESYVDALCWALEKAIAEAHGYDKLGIRKNPTDVPRMAAITKRVNAVPEFIAKLVSGMCDRGGE